MTNGPRTARARARAELTGEIKATARRHLAEHGAADLSLRAVARELGMVSSAIYRYFASRDELLTALIVDAFGAVADAAEAAAASTRGGVTRRWLAVTGAIRAWAVAHPHDYALVYGSPVPGYAAPPDTVANAARVSVAGIGVAADGLASGEIDPTRTSPVPRPVHADFERIRDAVAPTLPDEVLGRVLLGWTSMFGTISFELFGHLHRGVEHYDAFFEHQMRRAAAVLIGGPEQPST
jgi:AcrR family transcriptional regulator